MVLAFGGFCADVNYRRRLDPKLGSQYKTTNQPGATSEGWREASRIGANIIQADWIQCLPNCSPVEEGMGIASHFASISGALFGIYVSSLDGKRFVNEFGDRKVLTDSFLTVINKGGKALSIADSDGVAHLEKLRPGALEKMLAAGSVKKFPDADALAKAYGFDGKVLRSEIARYNELLKKGRDEDFGRPFDKEAKPMNDGPYYVSEMTQDPSRDGRHGDEGRHGRRRRDDRPSDSGALRRGRMRGRHSRCGAHRGLRGARLPRERPQGWSHGCGAEGVGLIESR